MKIALEKVILFADILPVVCYRLKGRYSTEDKNDLDNLLRPHLDAGRYWFLFHLKDVWYKQKDCEDFAQTFARLTRIAEKRRYGKLLIWTKGWMARQMKRDDRSRFIEAVNLDQEITPGVCQAARDLLIPGATAMLYAQYLSSKKIAAKNLLQHICRDHLHLLDKELVYMLSGFIQTNKIGQNKIVVNRQ